MPYIKQTDRDRLSGIVYSINNTEINNCGELNYIIFNLVKRYINFNGVSYRVYNDILGVLSCVSQELYRRSISFYEDIKISENGDV
jgi:hypothetical protein